MQFSFKLCCFYELVNVIHFVKLFWHRPKNNDSAPSLRSRYLVLIFFLTRKWNFYILFSVKSGFLPSRLIGKDEGRLSLKAFQDFEDANSFSLIETWETVDDLDRHIRSGIFVVLPGTKDKQQTLTRKKRRR